MSLRPRRQTFHAAIKAAGDRTMTLNELFLSIIPEWLMAHNYMEKCSHDKGVVDSKGDPETMFCSTCGTALVNTKPNYPNEIIPKLYFTDKLKAKMADTKKETVTEKKEIKEKTEEKEAESCLS